MYAIFTQSASGLHWRAMFSTLEEAQEDVAEGGYAECDAVLIVPIAEGSIFNT